MRQIQFFALLLLLGALYSDDVQGQECTFDEAQDRLCGWHTRFSQDDFSWEVRKTSAMQKTGPEKDRSGKGYFLSARASYTEAGKVKPRMKGTLARLASPIFSTNFTQIFRFWYYMYGRHVGSLKVYILINGTGELNQPEWARFKNKGAKWVLGEVRLPVDETFRVVIEAVTGNGVFGDIAIDSITVRDVAYDCTFETKDLCNFTQEKGDHFDWIMGRGKTPTRRTGPNRDHTFGTSEGAYMYIEATGPRRDTKAMLVSREFTKQPGPCQVSFFYHMYGAFIGELAVHVKWTDTGNTYGKRRWQKAGNQGNAWIGAEIDISEVQGPFQIAFEATRGRGSLADIAIDDFKLLGQQCTDYDDCISNPCQNNGTCIDSIGSYNCSCPSGYDGQHCEEECGDENKNCPYWSGIGECERNPKYMISYCKKSCAACVDAVCKDISEHCPLWAKLGECEKNPYYMLANCQRSCKSCIIDIDDCESNPCENGGTCIDGVRYHNCTCPDAYEGKNCELEVDECLSSPCENGGSCIDGLGYYNCSCPTGWIGDNCELDFDDCQSVPCEQGGTCVDLFNDYNCTCPFGYEGHDCEIDSDECINTPCFNGGTCIDKVGNYTCQCVAGWTGRNCEIDVDECESQPCQNGGTCYHGAGRDIYVCHCPSGWEGTNCEQDFDECVSNPCINGASCYNGRNMYNCTCPKGWQGRHCERDVNECLSSPCVNGGSCFHSLGDNFYVCACLDGWQGDRCEVESDECVGSPCQNNGTCVDKFNGYNCSCTVGYSGEHCEQQVTIPTTARPSTTVTVVTTTTTTTSPPTTISSTTSVQTDAPTRSATTLLNTYQSTSSTQAMMKTTDGGDITQETRTEKITDALHTPTKKEEKSSTTTVQSEQTDPMINSESDSDAYYSFGTSGDYSDSEPDSSDEDGYATSPTDKTPPSSRTESEEKRGNGTENPKTFEQKNKLGNNASGSVIAVITVSIIVVVIALIALYMYISRKKDKQNGSRMGSDHFNLTSHDGMKRHSHSSSNGSSEGAVENSFYGNSFQI